MAALGLALVMAPLFVSLCRSQAELSARGMHRLRATQRGTAELERLRAEGSRLSAHTFAVSELPSGRGEVSVRPAASGVRQVDLVLTWDERGRPARAEWTTLIDGETRRH